MIIEPRQTSSGQVTLMNDLGSGAWARGPRAWHVCFKWFLEVYAQHRRTEARSLGEKNQNGVLPKRFLKRAAVAPGWDGAGSARAQWQPCAISFPQGRGAHEKG